MEKELPLCFCGKPLEPVLDDSGKRIGVTHLTIEDEEHHSELFSSLRAMDSVNDN